MRGAKKILVWVCVLALEAPQTLAAVQSTATNETPTALSVSGTGAPIAGETVVVHGKALKARPLPDWLKKHLNAPLAPTPTATEKKLAPIVEKARLLWVLCTFIAVLAGGIAKNK
jgi:hypothetical protein